MRTAHCLLSNVLDFLLINGEWLSHLTCLMCNWSEYRDSHPHCSIRTLKKTQKQDVYFTTYALYSVERSSKYRGLFVQPVSHFLLWWSLLGFCLLSSRPPITKHQTINRGDNEDGNFLSPPYETDLREGVKNLSDSAWNSASVFELVVFACQLYCWCVKCLIGPLNRQVAYRL